MARFSKHRCGLLGLVAVAALILQVHTATSAGAHAVLVSSSPSDGAIMATAPVSVTLTFSESVDPLLTVLEIQDSQGHRYSPSAIHAEGTTEVTAQLPSLPLETYRIAWRTVAVDDRHSTRGTVIFGVGPRRDVKAALPPDPLPAPGEVLLGWLVLLGSGALIGGLVLNTPGRGRFRIGSHTPALHRTVATIAAAGGILALLGSAGLVIVQTGSISAAWHLSTAPYGQRTILRSAGLLALTLIALRRRARPSAASFTPLTIVLGLLTAVASALLGHAATSPARTVLESIHLLAAMLWFGVLLVVPLAVVSLRWRTVPRAELQQAMIAVLLPFGALAMGSVASLVVTGILLTGDSASTVDALLTSNFGHILILKLALTTAGGLLGWRLHRHLRSVGRSVGRPVRLRTLFLEALVLAVVVGCGAALASSAPPRGLRWQPSVTVAGSSTASGEVAGLLEAVTVLPNRPGRNFVNVNVYNSRRPAPAPITAVTVSVVGPNGQSSTAPAGLSANGDWVLPTDAMDAAGQWHIVVRIQRRAMPAISADYPWSVAGTIGGPAHRFLSQARVAPLAGGAAGVLTLVIALAALLAARARRRRNTGNPGNAFGHRRDVEELSTNSMLSA